MSWLLVRCAAGGLLALVLAASGAAQVRLYVANNDDNKLTVIDPETNKVTGAIAVSANPHAMAESADGKRLFVSSESRDLIDIVDRRTSKLIRSVPAGRKPNNMVLSPDGRRLFVCVSGAGRVAVFDSVSMNLVRNIAVGADPHAIYVTPDQTRMLVTTGAGITVLNIRTEAVEFTIPVEGAPRLLAMESDRHLAISRLFLQRRGLHGIEILDYKLRAIVSTKGGGKIVLPPAAAGAKPFLPDVLSYGIAVAPDHKSLWVNDSVGNAVVVYSLPQLERVATIQTGRAPDWIVFTADGKRCYVSNSGDNSVSAIDTGGMKEMARIAVGKVPKRLFISDSYVVAAPAIQAVKGRTGR